MHNEVVTNEEFEAAFTDENNQRIMSKVCGYYVKKIPSEELNSLKYIAVFRCIKKHDKTKNSKFTSSLYRFIDWECKKAMKDIKRNSSLSDIKFDYESPNINLLQTFCVRECLENLPPKDRQILTDYYMQGMTLSEIGIQNGYTTSYSMQKLRSAEQAFRRLYGDY